MKWRLFRIASGTVLLVLFVIPFFGCKTTETSKAKGAPNPQMATATSSESAETESIINEPVPAVAGPKRTITVGDFDAIGAFVAKYGDWDIGGGVAAMMTTALKESDRFIVLERAKLSEVLTEQQMKGEGLVSKQTGPKLGRIIGANLMVFGAITEFGTDDKGGGFSVGASGGSVSNLFGGAISRQTAEGRVVIDLRIVDTTTTEITEVYRIKEEISSSGWDASIGYDNVSFGTNRFMKTPIGQAVRKCINQAVQMIAVKANDMPWRAQVVDYDGEELYINAGSGAGIQIGDNFIVERIVKKLTDPETGQLLSVRKKELGLVRITSVEQKLAFGKFSPHGSEVPKRGDLVSADIQ